MIRYKLYEFYRAHYDAFDVTQTKQLATGQRTVTVICYLNTPTKGGGTRFTELEAECRRRNGREDLSVRVRQRTAGWPEA